MVKYEYLVRKVSQRGASITSFFHFVFFILFGFMAVCICAYCNKEQQ